MEQKTKRQLAREYLRIVRAAELPDFGAQYPSNAEETSNTKKRYFDVLTDLYVEHFTEEQLLSQLDYYRSEIGQSIVRVHSKLKTQYPQLLAQISEQLDRQSRNVQANVNREIGRDSTVVVNVEKEKSIRPINLPARWSIHVVTCSRNATGLNVAVGFDHVLEWIETETPFHYDFVATQYTVLIALADPSEKISTELWSDVHGSFQRVGGGSGGTTAKFTFSPHGPPYSMSSSAF